jgi:hypothetical protein
MLLYHVIIALISFVVATPPSDEAIQHPAQEKDQLNTQSPSIDSPLKHQIDELPKDLREELVQVTLKTKLHDVKTSADLYNVLATAPGYFRGQILLTDDPVLASLFPGVVSHCLERDDSNLLVRILSHPKFSPQTRSASLDPFILVFADKADIVAIVKSTLDPSGAQFNPTSRKTQDKFIRWLLLTDLWQHFSRVLSRRAGYFGDIGAFASLAVPTYKIDALEEAVAHRRLAFVRHFLPQEEEPRMRLLRVATTRHDLTMLRCIMGRDSLFPTLRIPEVEIPYILLLALEARDPSFLSFVQKEFFPQVSVWNVDTTSALVENALHLWKGNIGDTRSWQGTILRWGGNVLVKKFMGVRTIGDSPAVPQNLLGEIPFSFLVEYRRDETLVLDLLDLIDKALIRFVLGDAKRYGRLETLKKVIQMTRSMDPRWSPDMLLAWIRPHTPTIVTDWIFDIYQFSKKRLLEELTQGDSRSGLIFKQLASHPISDEEYFQLVCSMRNIKGLYLTLFGPFKNRLSLDQYQAAIYTHEGAMPAMLKKAHLDLSDESFTILIRKLANDPSFIKLVEQVAKAYKHVEIARTLPPASVVSRSERDLGPRILTIIRKIHP